MIKRMEFRFTVVAIIVISTVLLALLVGVNVITIKQNISKADASLERISTQVKDDNRYEVKGIDDNDMERSENPEVDRHLILKEENRSFEIYLNMDLGLVNTTAGKMYNIDDDFAYDLALEALEDNKNQGFVSEYRYLIIDEGEITRIIFLDYSFERSSEINFIFVSIFFYVLAVILVAVLVRIFLKPVMKPIREAYTKQKQFITDASHELKTPLTIISTNIQLIEMENGSTNWTKSINSQVDRLKSLSNDLVTLSRMEEQDMQLELSKVNLSDIVNDVVMGFEPAIEAKGKSFNCYIEDDIEIKGNHDALEKVMSVLMHNALKYSSKNSWINVNLKRKGKQIELQVANATGEIEIGSHDEYFERFYRADKSRNSKTGGFGIGLAVAKSTIESHKGKIEAKSPDGKSLVIEIIL